jgi:3-deoxy-manno-octulosonate cytidylyltransferase (CMP-KDO synthetase)
MTTPDYNIVIPARYASQRLPGKVLLDLAGKSVLQRAWERADASSAKAVVIATDDARVMEAADEFGAQAVMTRADHASGSDRIAECAVALGWPDGQLIVNLQGDEPLMPVGCLDQVAELLVTSPECEVASLYWPIEDASEVHNPNAVKVVVGGEGHALYFSRSPVPFARAFEDTGQALAAGVQWKRHLGLYAYRLGALMHYTGLAPSSLEQAERLEQLRILENGGRIAMAQACEYIPPGVDTAEDLERARESFNNIH